MQFSETVPFEHTLPQAHLCAMMMHDCSMQTLLSLRDQSARPQQCGAAQGRLQTGWWLCCCIAGCAVHVVVARGWHCDVQVTDLLASRHICWMGVSKRGVRLMNPLLWRQLYLLAWCHLGSASIRLRPRTRPSAFGPSLTSLTGRNHARQRRSASHFSLQPSQAGCPGSMPACQRQQKLCAWLPVQNVVCHEYDAAYRLAGCTAGGVTDHSVL